MEPQQEADTICQCQICQNTVQVSFAQCLRLGSWPYCHGQQMKVIQTSTQTPAEELDHAFEPLLGMATDILRIIHTQKGAHHVV